MISTIKRTNKLVSYAGLAVGFGQLPELITRMGINMPLVWNDITPWLKLAGLIGTIVAFWAANGADEHPTADQVIAASKLKEAEALAAQADKQLIAPTKVEIVQTDEEILSSRNSAFAEISRLRQELADKNSQE